jgi:hypothetical protein
VHKASNSGISTVGVIVSFMLVALAAVILSQTTTFFKKQSADTDRRVLADQILVDTASELQQGDFSELLNTCKIKNAFNGAAPSVCVQNGQLNPSLANQVGPLETLKSWQGDRNERGQVCVELFSCTQLAGSLILEVTISAHWQTAASGPLTSRNLVFRRARW